MVSMSPALPQKERRYRKKRSRDYQEEVPPEIPAKGKASCDLNALGNITLRKRYLR